MKVVLTEKPSVAREIAAFVHAGSRQDGYFAGRDYQVTWAYGHLVTLKEPDDYDPALKHWSLEGLPFIPEQFELKLVNDKLSRKQFAVVKRLFRGASEIICATDAGREGELIFRYILDMTRVGRKPVSRLWLSSLTQRAIREAFAQLKPASEYEDLYAAARCRSEADWIVGLNGTRSYTVRYGASGNLWSVGRVQTPVLAMIVSRDDAIETFQPEPFWELKTRYRDTAFRYQGDRFGKEEQAQQLLERVRGHDLTIEKIDRRTERSLPPQLFDLTELQRDMNRRFGLSAADTLKAAQSLYERKAITYPRTDSRYLSSDMKKEIPEILRSLRAARPKDIDRLDLTSLKFTRRIFDDRKVSDHHAIIPTGAPPGNLSPSQQKVYDAVVTRLIAVFYPPCLKEVTTVEGSSADVPFEARGVRVVQAGWTQLYPRKSKDKPQEDEQELPSFRVGEQGPHEPFVKRGETSPPRPYTENTLLGAMETAGKLVDDQQLRESLKEKGLGTPATRASIIETLLKRKYISRQKKTLIATDLGRYLIAVVGDQELKSPELTGQWEAKLREIEAGRLQPQRFMAEIAGYARRIVGDQRNATIDESVLGNCPKCGRPIIQGKRGFGCSGWRDGCTFVLWPTYQGRELSVRQVRQLLQRRALTDPVHDDEVGEVLLTLADSGQLRAVPVPRKEQPSSRGRRRTGAKKRSGTSAAGKTDDRGRQNASIGKCPLCAAEVVDRPKSFSCSGWQQGCKFVIWKRMAGKRISAATARKLLRDGESSLLKGFRSKAGRPFNARLKLEDGEVKFSFDS
jgi:DNA topoisomerase-3